MRADCFYQTTTEKTIPLLFLSQAECLKGVEVLSTYDRNCLDAQQFKGDIGQLCIINDEMGGIKKIFVGGGENNPDGFALSNIVTQLPEGDYRCDNSLSPAAKMAWSLSQYQFDKYKACEKTPRRLAIEEQEWAHILADANAIFLVRDLINTPTNDMGPQQLGNELEQIAKAHGAEFKQWVGEELLRDNFPAIHAVGRGAAAKPRLLSLMWGKESHPKVTLVGKGVCFDSGGLDLKPASGMRWMKKDMAGAAHVMGLAAWLMTHQVPIRLHVLIPAVENAVDGESYRPGDVVTMRNGMTVEIHNTDAEGRLILADALVKACEDKPELIIDFATLTGAARVALGTEIAALFANDDLLAEGLIASSREAEDPIWRLPLFAEYNDLFTSMIADMSNASEQPYAGAITAALFLQRFVTPGLPWAHFDVMAWNLGCRPGKPDGGEANGLRAVGHFLRQKYS
jgi:leucyl aminopeptidase